MKLRNQQVRAGLEKNTKSTLIDFWVIEWLDSDLIPRLLENFEKWENFMAILLSIKNNSYRRILSA